MSSLDTMAFLTGLTKSGVTHYTRLHDQEREDTERERKGVLSLIDAALSSPNLRPEALPHLFQLGAQAHGASKKELDQLKGMFSGLVGNGVDAQAQVLNPVEYTESPNITLAGDKGSVDTGVNTGPDPVLNYIPGGRKSIFTSPDEQAQKSLANKIKEITATQTALDPFKEKERQLKLRLATEKAKQQSDLLDRRLQNSLALVDARLKGSATQKAQAKRQQYLDVLTAQNDATPLDEQVPDEVLQARAAAMTLRDLQSGVFQREAKAELDKANAQAVPKRLAQGDRKLDQGDRSLDIREAAQDALDFHREVMRDLAVDKSLQSQYAQDSKVTVTRLQQLGAARDRLEQQKLTNIYLSEEQKQAIDDQIEKIDGDISPLRAQLQSGAEKYKAMMNVPEAKQPARVKAGGKKQYTEAQIRAAAAAQTPPLDGDKAVERAKAEGRLKQ